MPTTRAARRAAAERQLLELPSDVLGLILYQLPLAHDIALAGLTCRLLRDAAKLAFKARPYSGEVVQLVGHRSGMHVEAALDGRVITGSYDYSVKFWRGGECVRTIEAHRGQVYAVALTPDESRFFSLAGSSAACVKLWTFGGELERSYEFGQMRPRVVAVMPDGVHFVVGVVDVEGDGTVESQIRLYHVDGTLVHSFDPCSTYFTAMTVTPDGLHIISCGHKRNRVSDDHLVKVWSVASKSLLSTCKGHTNDVMAVAAMPDGQRILSGGFDKTVRVWLLNGTLKNTFTLHKKGVRALVALPHNQHALSASNDSTVKLFNVNDGAVLRKFTHHSAQVFSLALMPDGLRFVSGSHDETACIVYHGLAPVSR